MPRLLCEEPWGAQRERPQGEAEGDDHPIAGRELRLERRLAFDLLTPWVTDRPAPVTDVPIVLWQGAKDDFIRPSYQQCGIDRLEGQNADLTVCVDPEGDHSSLIPNSAPWVRSFLAEKLLGEAAPAACAGIETIDPELKCGAPIPNSVDPSEP